MGAAAFLLPPPPWLIWLPLRTALNGCTGNYCADAWPPPDRYFLLDGMIVAFVIGDMISAMLIF